VYLTASQLNILANESARYRSLVLLLGVGGLRWGEAAALRVGDVEFLRRRIELHRNAVQVGSKVIVGTLKSNENRTVVLPRFVIDALAETANGKGLDDLLWPTASGGYMGPPASKESWLSGAVERCRKSDPTFPRVTAHALRHTAASLAISAGANPKVVQRMLGHASAAMTLDVYADLFDSDLASVAESVGKMWARQAQAHERSKRKGDLPATMLQETLSLLSGLN
jgi:integrase